MQRACAVELEWVEPLLPRLDELDVPRLLGAKRAEPPRAPAADADGDAERDGRGARDGGKRRNDDDAVAAARERYRQRQRQRQQ